MVISEIKAKIILDTSDIKKAKDILSECLDITKQLGLSKRETRKLLRTFILKEKEWRDYIRRISA